MIRLIELKKNWREGVLQIISTGFILLFTYAAVNKLQEIDVFQNQLEQFPFISDKAVWIVWTVPAGLIFVAILLLFERMKLIAFYSSFLMMLLFILYIIAVLNFAESIPCSCAGVFNSWSWTDHLYFNIGVLLLAVVGIALSYNLKTIESES